MSELGNPLHPKKQAMALFAAGALEVIGGLFLLFFIGKTGGDGDLGMAAAISAIQVFSVVALAGGGFALFAGLKFFNLENYQTVYRGVICSIVVSSLGLLLSPFVFLIPLLLSIWSFMALRKPEVVKRFHDIP